MKALIERALAIYVLAIFIVVLLLSLVDHGLHSVEFLLMRHIGLDA